MATDATIISLVLALVIVLIGLIGSFFLYKKSLLKLNESQNIINKSNTELAVLHSQLEQERESSKQQLTAINSARDKLSKIQQELNDRHIELAEMRVSKEKEQEANDAKLALLETAKQQLAGEFKLLANQILESKQESISKYSKEMIGGLMQPMQSTLEGFKQRIEVVHKEDLEGRASLVEQLKQLQTLNHQMTDEAKNLTKALKGDSKLQGNWGELILEKLLESTGLREGIEFEREKNLVDESGKRYRPDVILNLPNDKHIIIDSKVSLTAYEKAVNHADNSQKSTFIKEHLNSLTRHIQTLADKRYEHLEMLNAPDFVLMFIPIEGAYLLAIEADSSVFETAFEKKVAVVTPTTLFTTLKTIEQLWRYERQSKHTVALIKRASEVHDKFVGFVENFEKVGKQLATTQNSYDLARKQMTSGTGNLIRQAEMLKELAGKTKKDLPKHLLAEAEDKSFIKNL